MSALLRGWVVVIPVKQPERSKSRLGALRSDALAAAIALDTVAAAARTGTVARVWLLTDGPTLLPAELEGSVTVLHQRPAGGLNSAILAALPGIRAVHQGCGTAVLLGDLPALKTEEFAAALFAAAGHRLALVPDAENSGSTLITAAPGVGLVPQFGVGSAARHRAAGHVELPAGASLRRDVDTAADLAAAQRLGLGPRTAAVLAAGEHVG